MPTAFQYSAPTNPGERDIESRVNAVAMQCMHATVHVCVHIHVECTRTCMYMCVHVTVVGSDMMHVYIHVHGNTHVHVHIAMSDGIQVVVQTNLGSKIQRHASHCAFPMCPI